MGRLLDYKQIRIFFIADENEVRNLASLILWILGMANTLLNFKAIWNAYLEVKKTLSAAVITEHFN